MPDDLTTLSNLLCHEVYAAGHAFTRAYKPLLEPMGLTYPQYLVMVALWEQDDQTVGGLGEKLSLESNTLTPLLKRMEAMGHLSRTRDKLDERQVRLRLTVAGRTLQAQAADVSRCILDILGMSAEHLRRVQGEVAALRNALETHNGAEALRPRSTGRGGS